MSSADETERPTLRVIRGDATAEEIAALLAVVAARSAGDTAGSRRSTRKPVSTWADRSDLTRRPIRPGTGAWAASARPR